MPWARPRPQDICATVGRRSAAPTLRRPESGCCFLLRRVGCRGRTRGGHHRPVARVRAAPDDGAAPRSSPWRLPRRAPSPMSPAPCSSARRGYISPRRPRSAQNSVRMRGRGPWARALAIGLRSLGRRSRLRPEPGPARALRGPGAAMAARAALLGATCARPARSRYPWGCWRRRGGGRGPRRACGLFQHIAASPPVEQGLARRGAWGAGGARADRYHCRGVIAARAFR